MEGLSGARQLRRQRPRLFQGSSGGRAPIPTLIAKGRGCAEGSTAENAKSARGEHLVAELAKDAKRRNPAAGVVDRRALHHVRTPERLARLWREPDRTLDRGHRRPAGGVGEDGLHPELRRERRLFRSRPAPHPGAGRRRRAQPRSPPTGENLRGRAGGPRSARADDGCLAVDAGRVGELGGLRPHLGDPLPRGAVRGDRSPTSRRGGAASAATSPPASTSRGRKDGDKVASCRSAARGHGARRCRLQTGPPHGSRCDQGVPKQEPGVRLARALPVSLRGERNS